MSWSIGAALRFTYAYGLYVLHVPINLLCQRLDLADRVLRACAGRCILAVPIYFLLVAGLAVAAALISWNAFEKHFLKLKRHF